MQSMKRMKATNEHRRGAMAVKLGRMLKDFSAQQGVLESLVS